LPIVIEIVDTQEKLEQFLVSIEGEIHAGLATLEKVRVRFYRSLQAGSHPADQP
jgi:PII-like signaling protein